VGTWYAIGLWLGVGTAFGVVLAGAFGGVRAGLAAALVVAAGAALALGWLIDGWERGVAGAVGGAAGATGAGQVTAGALRRGGTRGGTSVLLAGVAAVVAALAFVPVVGYLEAVVVPALGARLRRRAPERFAGLRTLAK
jgi:hypothetical protein